MNRVIKQNLRARTPARIQKLVNGGIRQIRELVALQYLRHELNSIPKLNSPFFVNIVSGGLHIADLSLRCIPRGVDVVVILNGLDEWEMGWVSQNIVVSGFLRSRYRLRHDQILDFLFDNLSQPFGILDYDCFVFNEEYFHEIVKIDRSTSMNAYFVYRNDMLGLPIPQTYFLFFNEFVINNLRRRYQVGCGIATWSTLSLDVQERLRSIGVDDGHLPEDFKKPPLFDTLRVLMMLSVADGFPSRCLQEYPAVSLPSNDLYHVGDVSRPNFLEYLWHVRGSYFWRRALDAYPDVELRQRYLDKFKPMNCNQILDSFPDSRSLIGKETLDFMDRVINQNSPPIPT